ncbi:MAG: eCIS core domain-containing protein [Gemmatimonadales bacterium]
MQRRLFQAKLTVNQPGDRFEQEADRVAEAVLHKPDLRSTDGLRHASPTSAPGLQRMCAECEEELHGSATGIQRACSECEEESKKAGESVGRLQAKEMPGRRPEVTPRVQVQVDALRGGGHPLPESERSFFESRFGVDFADVRIHTDAQASESARAVNALAYTVDNHIVLGSGRYAPGTAFGRRLLAHELAHVVQQTGSKQLPRAAPAHEAATGTRAVEGGGGGTVGLASPLPNSGRSILRAACPKPPTHLGDTPVPADQDCEERADTVFGEMFFFCTDSDALTDESETRLLEFVPGLQRLPVVEVHGYASPEGPAGREVPYNLNLSCHRARSVADLLVRNGVMSSRVQTFKHGGTTAFGPRSRNRVAVIPGAEPVTPGPLHTRFRVAAVSFLACAPCNPFTDDGAVITSPLRPPTAEPPSGSSFRMKHWIEAEVVSSDGSQISSSSVVDAGQEVGQSGFCGKTDPAAVVSKTGPLGPVGSSDPVHGEVMEWESDFVTRVNADVPCTLPDAPCGPLGKNPMIPPISNRFRMRIFADGTTDSAFVSASTFPFHHLYENGSVKMFAGQPVRPEIDFDSWATSTGVSLREADIGFKALIRACCNGGRLPGCLCTCSGGSTDVFSGLPFGIDPTQNFMACLGVAGGLALRSCPISCQPAGTACPTPKLAPNPPRVP